MADFDDLENDEREEAERIKLDGTLYQFFTKETLEGYAPMIFGIGQLEGDFIGQFNRKVQDKGITVNEEYLEQLWKNKKPVPGVDLRSGEYGKNYAGAGFFLAGCRYYARGDLVSARANFEKALELWPHNILARSLKAQLHWMQDNNWLAAAEAENAILLNPVTIAEKDSASRAVLEVFSSDFEEKLTEMLVHSYYIKGRALYDLLHFEEALVAFDQAARLNPSLLVAVEMRQLANMELQHWEEALLDSNTLIAAGHELERLYQYRGYILRSLERYWESITDFTAAIAMNPDLTDAYLQRADSNFNEGFFEDAINDAAEAIKRHVPFGHFFRGRAYLASGEYTKAIADFDIALKENPEIGYINTCKKKAIDYRDREIITQYKRKNEKGEWEQVEKKDGEIVQIRPFAGYQELLDKKHREEAEEKKYPPLTSAPAQREDKG